MCVDGSVANRASETSSRPGISHQAVGGCILPGQAEVQNEEGSACFRMATEREITLEIQWRFLHVEK